MAPPHILDFATRTLLFHHTLPLILNLTPFTRSYSSWSSEFSSSSCTHFQMEIVVPILRLFYLPILHSVLGPHFYIQPSYPYLGCPFVSSPFLYCHHTFPYSALPLVLSPSFLTSLQGSSSERLLLPLMSRGNVIPVWLQHLLLRGPHIRICLHRFDQCL